MEKIASEFERKWNFPHCIAAIDGKHIIMQRPYRSGSYFINYKKTFSKFMGGCNANYEFILVDVGDTGRNSDLGVLANKTNSLNIPGSEEIPHTGMAFPYVLVADEAFPLKTNIMKPYPQEILQIKERIFNYRLSRARRIIENSFGILAARC